MFKSRQPTGQATLSAVPTAYELRVLLDKANKSFRVPVETAIDVGGKRFLLSVLAGKPEPRWTFYSEVSLLWEITSNDLEMVSNFMQGTVEKHCSKAEVPGPSSVLPTKVNNPVAGAPQVPQPQAPPAAAVPQDIAPAGGIMLAGDVAKVELANVIQSILICRMTGRLTVNNKLEFVHLYFEDGNFVHAMLGNTMRAEVQVGDMVILDLLLWDSGEFNFQPTLTTRERTIKRRIDSLLMEGATLTDHLQYLKKHEISPNSMLQKSTWLTEAEFETAVTKGIPVSLDDQKRIYCAIDGRHTLEDILKESKLPRHEWVPIMFNLLNLELVCLPHSTGTVPAFKSDEVDSADAWDQLMVHETKVLPCNLFMHFFKNEFLRARKCQNTRFTVAVFDILYRSGDAYELLPPVAMFDVLSQLRAEKSEVDLVGHFHAGGFAMLFPYEDSSYAINLAERFIARVNRSPSSTPYDLSKVAIRIGTATAPFDSDEPDSLLKKAHKAKQVALKEDKLISTAANL